MNTVIYKEIDGFKIITGFDKKVVDPVETNKRKTITYFELKRNEQEVNEKEYDRLLTLIKDNPNCKITISGDIVENNVNKSYLLNNKIIKIEKLGDKIKGKLLEDCTPEELEDSRMFNLSETDKRKEYDNLNESLKNRAINVRLEAELLNEDSPLKKSQDFYSKELSKLKTKYGVK